MKKLLLFVCVWGLPAAARADFFDCYEGCAKALATATDCLEGRDYTVTVTTAAAAVSVLSFHGGRIETGTSGISLALAGRYQWNRYDFDAHGTPSCLVPPNDTDVEKLHITATNFNDSRAIAVVGAHPKAVAIHGYGRSRGYDRGVICVGGRDATARTTFIAYINTHTSEWPNYPLMPINAPTAPNGTSCSDLDGTDADNLVNRTMSHLGLQLELHPDMRADLTTMTTTFDALRNVVYPAINEAMAVNQRRAQITSQ